jgi:hypothetical protein
MLSYHHWDEEDAEESWDLYEVVMHDPHTYQPLGTPLRVVAQGLEQALNIYEVLLKYNK